jgi:ABC-2 type transport system ATP-binding protein
MPSSSNAIEINGLTKKFYRSRPFLSDKKKETVSALNEIDFILPKGEIFALLGPNGAGKTTLIKILCSLISPDKGSASVYGFDTVREAAKVQQCIGLVLGEDRGFYPTLTGRQNLEFFAALYNLNAKEARKRIDEACALFEINTPDKIYQQYSSGNRQRLALARCFLSRSPLLFLDEPTKSLDPNSSENLMALLKRFVEQDKNRCVFLTTHQIEEAAAIADRIGILSKGKLVCILSPAEASRNSANRFSSLLNTYKTATEEAPYVS